MRSNPTAWLSCVMLWSVGMAAALPQQGTPPATAGATRPNVRVIGDLPESQLFMVMNLIADSLNVTCEYCHVRTPPQTDTVVGGWQFDREDKPAKQVGRRMLQMVKDLNAQQFGGRPVVTCFTCHHGSLQPDRLPALPPQQQKPAATSALPDAAKILAAYRAAVGADAAARLRTSVLTGTDERSENRRGTLEVETKGDDKFRMTLRLPPPGPLGTQAFDGDSGWVSSDGPARRLAPADVQALKAAANRYRVVKVADPPDAMRVTGVEHVQSRRAYVVETTVDPRTTRRLYFDVENGLLLRELTIVETIVVPLQNQVDYEDYRDIDGVKLPFTIRVSDGAPYATSVRRFTAIKHNVVLDDALFKMPEGRLSAAR